MKSTVEMIIEKKVHLELPTLPNWIKGTSYPAPNSVADHNFSVADLSDEQLKALGVAWTEALIKHAQEKRKEPQAPLRSN